MARCIEFRVVYATVGGDQSPDWDGGARSTLSYSYDHWWGWTVPATVRGVVVGLNEEDVDTSWYEIDQGFRFKDGQFKFLELGTLIDPEGPWFTYEEGDRFYIFRVDNIVYYVRRPVGTPESQVYFDDALPGMPLPGPVLRVSPVPSYGEVFLDCALWAYNDSVNTERSGETWTSYPLEINGDDLLTVPGTPGHLIANSASLYPTLRIIGRGSDGTVDADSGAIDGQLPLSVSGSGSFQQGGNIELTFEVLGFDRPVDTYMIGEMLLDARGGTYMTGDGNVGISGFLPLPVLSARSIPGSTYITGELPAPVIAMTGSEVTGKLEASIFGELPLALAATGTEDGQTKYDAYMIGEMPLTVIGSAIGGGTTTDGGILGELPLLAQGAGRGSVGTIDAFMDLELPLPILYAQSSAELPNEFLIILEFTGEVVTQPDAEFVDIAEVFYATTSPLQIAYSSLLASALQIQDTPRTFSQRVVDITNDVQVMTEARPQFVNNLVEALNFSAPVSTAQIMEVAERLNVLGIVQTFYEGVIAMLSAMTVTDSKVSDGGGSSGGGGGGIIIIDDSGTDTSQGTTGDPALITIVGSFPAGSEIEVVYETDTGGETTNTTLITSDSTEDQAATAATSSLDAETDVEATLVP